MLLSLIHIYAWRMVWATAYSLPEGPSGLSTFSKSSYMALYFISLYHIALSSAWVRASWASTSLSLHTDEGLWMERQGTESTRVGTPPRAS